MPHQCLKCSQVYDNTSDAIIKGCSNCGSKLFLYLKKTPVKSEEIELTKHEKELVLQEVESIAEIRDSDAPIILKLENIRVIKPGKYEIDINQLMKKDKPIVYKIQEGTYVIDLNFLRGEENEQSKK